MISISVFFQEETSMSAKESSHSEKIPHFLHLVVSGQQDEAEALLKENPKLGRTAGDVIDHAKRAFKNITGFQYAVWALDWRMWEMILKYLPAEEAQKQTEESKKGAWMKEHGEHAKWDTLLSDQKTYYVRRWWPDRKQDAQHCRERIGKLQLLLPAHVLQEYYSLARHFDPRREFEDQPLPERKRLPDELEEMITKDQFDFGLFRHDTTHLEDVWCRNCEDEGSAHVRSECAILEKLYNVRKEQRNRLIWGLGLQSLLNARVISSDNKERALLFDPIELNQIVLEYVGARRIIQNNLHD
jgi:hypothetical protein